MTLRTRRYANERPVVLAGLGIASALCVALELVRELQYGAPGYRFLLWNLFLAWIPLVLSLEIYDRYRRGAGIVRLSPWIACWLLFLPNAPYIFTDFIHLSAQRPAPLWFDGALLSAFGWTGLILGFVSIYLLHAVARHRFGGAAAWRCVGVVLTLVSVGIYLGRFLRWNSWGVVLRPGRHVAQLLPHLTDGPAIAHATLLTIVSTSLLACAYFAFYVLIGIRLDPGSDRSGS